MGKEASKKYRETHREKVLADGRAYNQLHREEKNTLSREYGRAHREEDREARIVLRKEVLEHYGGKCACCGESAYEFLSIDHVNGGGNQHRKEISRMVCPWLKKNNFPDGFQVLCHNCNQAKGIYGYCPHQKGDGNEQTISE